MEAHEIKMSLFKNACTFIEEAARKAVEAKDAPWQWKFAILNLVQAIELSFKERLRNEHPAFVYQDIDVQKHTISLRKALSRVQKVCPCNFTEKEIRTIKSAVKKRDAIVHHEFEIDQREAKVIFARLIGFLSHFFNKHLDKFIDLYVDSATWKKVVEISEYGESLYQAALKNIADNDYQDIFFCPSCNYETFVYQDEINTCLVCGHLEDVHQCAKCGEILLGRETYSIETGESDCELYCYQCYDGEMGMDYYYEQAHGK